MFRFFHYLALIGALCASNLPLGLLQVGVWIKMFDQFYQETQSVAVSTEWTFDGKHKCLGCELVDDLTLGDDESVSQGISHSKDLKVTKAEMAGFLIQKMHPVGYVREEVYLIGSGFPWIEVPPPRELS
tara:strand:+ start:239 stop:625 length:387 start_codon:yes stop_codon:yes gene_type:complete